MRTDAQRRYDLRRALAKRGPSASGWRWIKRPTKLELAAFRRLQAKIADSWLETAREIRKYA